MRIEFGHSIYAIACSNSSFVFLVPCFGFLDTLYGLCLFFFPYVYCIDCMTTRIREGQIQQTDMRRHVIVGKRQDPKKQVDPLVLHHETANPLPLRPYESDIESHVQKQQIWS